jgi:hypothetical protein
MIVTLATTRVLADDTLVLEPAAVEGGFTTRFGSTEDVEADGLLDGVNEDDDRLVDDDAKG